jgi:hypothetical protein
VGVNFWYDMSFETPLWCYFSFLQQLQHVVKDDDGDDDDDEEDDDE